MTDELTHLLNRAIDGVALPAEGDRLRELVGHLVAGQCTDHVATCTQHHATPVDGCPYPKCKTARAAATV